MKTYNVTVPVAGHITIEVEAEDEEAAVQKALEADISRTDIDEWTTLEAFHKGNICYCPTPWQAEATEVK